MQGGYNYGRLTQEGDQLGIKFTPSVVSHYPTEQMDIQDNQNSNVAYGTLPSFGFVEPAQQKNLDSKSRKTCSKQNQKQKPGGLTQGFNVPVEAAAQAQNKPGSQVFWQQFYTHHMQNQAQSAAPPSDEPSSESSSSHSDSGDSQEHDFSIPQNIQVQATMTRKSSAEIQATVRKKQPGQIHGPMERKPAPELSVGPTKGRIIHNRPEPGTNKKLKIKVKTPASGGRKRKSNEAPKDPNMPKKPRNAFLFFKKAVISDVSNAGQRPTLTQMTSIIAGMWKDLAPEDKEKYLKEAEEDRNRYTREMNVYTEKQREEEINRLAASIDEDAAEQASTSSPTFDAPPDNKPPSNAPMRSSTPSSPVVNEASMIREVAAGSRATMPAASPSPSPAPSRPQSPPDSPTQALLYPCPTCGEEYTATALNEHRQGGKCSEAINKRVSIEVALEIMKVLEVLCKNPIAVDFLASVEELFPMVAADYRKVIKHPMDLGAIVEKLRTGRYNNSDRVARHVHRVFENCKTFNSTTNRVFYNRAQHLKDYFDKLWAETSLVRPKLRRRQRLSSHQQATPIALRGKELQQCVDAVNSCGLSLSAASARSLREVLNGQQAQYGKFFELVLTLFGFDPSKEKLEDIFDKLATTEEGGILHPETLAQWHQLEKVLLSVVGKKMEQIYRGNDFSCVWGIPWRFVWAKTRAKELAWPAMVLIDSKTPDSVAKANLSRIPAAIRATLTKQRAKTVDPTLVEFFGTNEFAWVRDEFAQRYSGRHQHKYSGANAATREKWEAALYDMELAINELQKTDKEEEEDLPESMAFTINPMQFHGGFAEPDSDICDVVIKTPRPKRPRPKSKKVDSTPKRKKATPKLTTPKPKRNSSESGCKRKRSIKDDCIVKINIFVRGLIAEDPGFYDCYLFDQAAKRGFKCALKSARKNAMIHHINSFVKFVIASDPQFFDVYELPKANESKQKRLHEEEVREERENERKMKLAQKVEELRVAKQQAKSRPPRKRGVPAHHKLVKISLEEWNAYQILNRGQQVKYSEALEFFANLNPDALQQKTEYYTEINNGFPRQKNGSHHDLEGQTDSDEECFGGCPDEVESIPLSRDRKKYMKNCMDLLEGDIKSLEKMYSQVMESMGKNKKRIAKAAAAYNEANGIKSKSSSKKKKDGDASKKSPSGKPPSKEYRNSRYRGVCFQGSKFIARISMHGKVVTLGRYDSEEEAAKVYDAKAREVFGSKALVNFSSDEDADSGEEELPW